MTPADARRKWLEVEADKVLRRYGLEGEKSLCFALAALLDAPMQALEEALEPFGSGRDWGVVKAFLVHGPATKEEGIQLAKGLTKIQAAADAALAALPWRQEEKR